MGRLAVDHLGNIYQTGGDRADGLGFGYYPECQTQGDLTLGSAYLKAQRRRNQELLARKRAQAQYDQNQQVMGAMKRAQTMQKRSREAQPHLMMQNPVLKAAVLKQYLMSGMGSCNCNEIRYPNQGNVLTANGQSGFAGMSQSQKVLHNVLLGMGYNAEMPVDPRLEKIRQARLAADRMLRLNAVPVKPNYATRIR